MYSKIPIHLFGDVREVWRHFKVNGPLALFWKSELSDCLSYQDPFMVGAIMLDYRQCNLTIFESDF